MPRYLKSYIAGKGDGCCCDDDSIDRNSAIFFNNLANKLLEMSKAIETRIEELSNKVCVPETRGFVFASIETPQMILGVKLEYVEYIKRYGPPEKGQFNQTKLNAIRIEMGIPAEF